MYPKSPEDTVLRKLLWYRDGGRVSEKRWRDVVAVLRVNAGKLDGGYMTLWSTSLGVADLLELARDTANRR